MRIAGRSIGAHDAPYVIAEIGVNHDGSVERALELTQHAAEAGADAIKLQYFETDRLLSREASLAVYQRDAGATDPREMLKSLELPIEAMIDLAARAHELNLHAIVTVFSVELVERSLRMQCDAYKTASPDIVNRPLIEALMTAAPGKLLILSTGAASLHEVENAKQWLDDHPHVFMQCVSAYPTPDESASLAARRALARLDAAAIGYSDHTRAVDTGALAVAAGARMLEKHLTYDRAATGPDHAASLEPSEFAEYIRLVRRAWTMLGEEEKKVLDIEGDVRTVSRQSLTTARALPAGHVLQRTDLTTKRPGTGIPPARIESVLGRRLARQVAADTPLHDDDLSG